MNLMKLGVIALGFSMASTVWADGVAQVKSGDGKATMTIEYKDQTKVRMNVPDDDKGYMLVSGGNAYTVADIQGQTMVMDMRKMARMAKSMGAQTDDEDDLFELELVEIKDTGQTEQIAGYKGHVHQMKWRDRDGEHTSEVVLSDNPEVVDFSNSWMYMAETMAKVIAEKGLNKNSIGEYLRKNNQGILRLGDEFVVISIKSGSLPAARFEVPKSTFKMPSFGG